MNKRFAKRPRAIVLFTVIALAGAFTAGCNDDGGGLKKSITDSLQKQTEMKSYTFAGTADLDIGALPQTKDANPITSSLLTMFQSGKLEWSGAAAVDPVRMEANVKTTQAGSSAGFELPMLLKDNQLYINIPLINKKDEYFGIDLAKLSTMSGQKNALSAESLKHATQAASGISGILIGDLNAKWFKKAKDPVTFKDGGKGTQIRIEITDKNKKAFGDSLLKELPAVIDKLSEGGFISADQAAKLKEDSKTLTLEAPGLLSFTIDGNGFARDQQIDLKYIQAGKDGLPVNRHLKLGQTYDGINQEPKFEKEVPKQVKPFEDVLRLLFGGASK